MERMLGSEQQPKKKTRWKTFEYSRRVLHFPLFVASTRVCHTHSLGTKNKHNRKWLIIVCLFFSLFVLSLFFLRFLWLFIKKKKVFNFSKIHLVVGEIRLYVFISSIRRLQCILDNITSSRFAVNLVRFNAFIFALHSIFTTWSHSNRRYSKFG